MDDGQSGFGDFMASLQANAPAIDPQQTLLAALNAPPPQINMPERQAPDTSSVLPLAGLVMAAKLAQRRQPGQSRVSQFLDSAVSGAGFAAQSKQDLEAQASKRYQEDVSTMMAKQQLEKGAAELESARTNNAMTKATAPMKLDLLVSQVQNAKTEAEASQYTLKLVKAKSMYADELAAAEAAYATARPGIAKDEAAAKVLKAQADMKEAESKMVQAISMRDRFAAEQKAVEEGKKQGNFKPIGDSIPGTPQQVAITDPKGQMFLTTVPMNEGDAQIYLTKKYKELKREGLTELSKEEYVKQQLPSLVDPPAYRNWINSRTNGGMNPNEGAGPDGKPLTPTAQLNTKAASTGVIPKNGVAINSVTNEIVDSTGAVLSKEAAAAALNMHPDVLVKKYPQLAKNPRYNGQAEATAVPRVNMQQQAGQVYMAAVEGLRALKSQEPGPYESMRNPNAKAEWAARVAAVSAEVNRLQAAYEAAANQGAP